MQLTLQILTVVLSIILVVAISLQVKGMSGTGMFGTGYSTFRTRRGFERVLYRATIVFMFLFVIVALLAARQHAGDWPWGK